MNTREWITIGALLGAVTLMAGVAVLNSVLEKVAPNLIQWNKAPAIPAIIFYGFVAYCGAIGGGNIGNLLSDTAPEQRLNTLLLILLGLPVWMVCQALISKGLRRFHR